MEGITEGYFDEFEKLMEKSHEIIDELTEMAEKTKTCYNETNDELLKVMYKNYNIACCESAKALLKTNIETSGKIIKVLCKVVSE